MRILYNICLLLLISLLGIKKSIAQCPIPLSEMEVITSYNSAEFEKYINKKGYKIIREESDSNTKVCRCKAAKSDKTADNIRRSVNPNGIFDVTYFTTDSKYFDDTKDQILRKGYKYKDEHPFYIAGTSTRQTLYVKDNKNVASLFTYIDKNGVKWYAFLFYKWS